MGWGQGLARSLLEKPLSILKMVQATNVLHLLMLNVGKLSGPERQLDCLKFLMSCLNVRRMNFTTSSLDLGFALEFACSTARRASASMVSQVTTALKSDASRLVFLRASSAFALLYTQ